MMDGQSISPKRMDNKSGIDFLSDLPLDIIHMILALVPTKDVVRTSVLSRQWRYTWASLPQLVFDEMEGDSIYKDFDRLINFVNHAINLHKGPIHKFKVSTSVSNRDVPVSRDVYQWLLYLSRTDIRELQLHVWNHWLDLSSSLFSFQNLTRLELIGKNMYFDPPPPTFKGFSCLRCLVLSLSVSSDTIESLVASCPLLEDLMFVDLYCEDTVVRVSAPNLKYLDLTGAYKEIYVDAPLLVKMSVELGLFDNYLTDHLEQGSSVCKYTELFGCCTNLESLSGVEDFTKYLTVGIESYHSSLVFNQLKVISLPNVNFEDKKEFSVVVHLIMDSPNLYKLEISIDWYIENASEAPQGSFWDSGCAPTSTFEKLRVIKMVYARGLPQEMEFIKFLLKSSPVLDTISLDRSHYQVSNEVWLGLMAELVRYGQDVSPNAKILFKPY